MKQRAKGFTVLELLIVISIMMILAAMLIIGLRALTNQGQASATRARLQNCQAMLQALDANQQLANVQNVFGGSATYSSNAINAPGDVTTSNNVTRTTDPAILNTQAVMLQVLRLPDNTASFQKLPQGDLLKLSTAPSILLDGWGNPMIFVPGGGLNTNLGGKPVVIQAPDKKGFWASAGPDGNFLNGDDNVYSFVSQN